MALSAAERQKARRAKQTAEGRVRVEVWCKPSQVWEFKTLESNLKVQG